MYTERVNDIIAHFIGLFDSEVEMARMRIRYLEGRATREDAYLPPDGPLPKYHSPENLQLIDYTPGISYKAPHYGFETEFHFARLALPRHVEFSNPHGMYFRHRVPEQDAPFGSVPPRHELVIHPGPESATTYVVQANLLQDDDYLDMTNGPRLYYDLSYVHERLAEYWQRGEAINPFAGFHATNTYEGVKAIADQAHETISHYIESGATSLGTGNDLDFLAAGKELNGSWVNGEQSTDLPKLKDSMPDRGIAKPEEDPKGTDGPLHHEGAEDSLTVAAGANVLANEYSLVNTGVISPVMAVMGDYQQVDSIVQSWVYSDRDTIDDVVVKSPDTHSTIANNIASFARTAYDMPKATATSDDGTPAFPSAWRVSVINGDVSFVNWVEQYHFMTDNDVMTVTSNGSSATVLTGGNVALNLASFLGLSLQYDLVIVGGNVLDINMISQLAVLYDNDTVKTAGGISAVAGTGAGTGAGATVQTGNNLLWNEATIHNIGLNNRFDSLPDYVSKTVQNINDRNATMPDGLTTDPVFAGKHGLNVLYITGNLFDINYIRQTSVLGDADHVTQAASSVLKSSVGAKVSIDTGSNIVGNSAHIVDYDSFGAKTYLGGQLYSDAVLIQGGIVENDTSIAHLMNGGLANEIIAFLHDDATAGHSTDGVFNGGHDLSWTLAHPADVMQTAVA